MVYNTVPNRNGFCSAGSTCRTYKITRFTRFTLSYYMNTLYALSQGLSPSCLILSLSVEGRDRVRRDRLITSSRVTAEKY